MESEDECLMELDVYIDNMQEDLHILQYPLRPADRPYGDHGPLVKVDQMGEGPSNEQIEGENTISNLRMTYQLEDQIKNYDQDAIDNRVSLDTPYIF